MSVKSSFKNICKIVKTPTVKNALCVKNSEFGKAVSYSLGFCIVISSILFLCLAGLISLLVPDHHLHFLREITHSIECIIVSVISYFFGGAMKNDK